MDKIGQILKDGKMALISGQNTLADRTTICGEHFTQISVPFCRLGGVIYEFVT